MDVMITILATVIPLATLVITTLVLVLRLGHMVGKLTERLETHARTLDTLQDRHVSIDARCDDRIAIITRLVAVSEETTKKLDQIYNLLIEKGMS
jgi:hypothetical protein